MLVRGPYARCISLQEGAALVPPQLVAGLGMLSLMSMVGMFCLAFEPFHPRRFAAWSEDTSPQRPISPAERRLWRLGWVLSTLLCFGLAVTEWRYMTTRGYVSVPANSPLIDHMIWILTVVGIIGEFAVICVYATRQGRADRSRRGDSSSA